ncbi:MAG: hypothetical protein FWG64_11910 [Firmicutes bacterium]|nr:hypothetical protein [Bacillota bacterium]
METTSKESKIALYDSNDNKIGETFMRRAKQLVKQQRAAWTDESQTALKFGAGMENFVVPETAIIAEDTAEFELELETEFTATKPTKSAEESWIVLLAEQRIKARKFFILHSIIAVPAIYPLVALVFFFLRYVLPWNEDVIYGGVFGSWITAYVIHFCVFFKNSGTPLKRPIFEKKQTRKERQLALEIAKIKASF